MNYTCKNCGSVFDDSMGVCPTCGAPVEAAPQAQPEAQQQPYQQQPYQQQAYQQPQQGYQYTGAPVYNQTGAQGGKSKMAAGLLGIFLGWLGVHNFYLGFTGKAIAQLLISVLSCFTLSFVSGIWGLIEGILILTGSQSTDANGMPLTD